VPAATVYIALLRAVNVGGRNSVAMAELRALCDDLGLSGARTILQSGNVVFRSALARAKIVPLLEAEIAQRFGVKADVVLRSAREWTALVEANPFPREAIDDPAHLHVMCCVQAPSAAAVSALAAAIVGRETVQAVGRDLYLVYPDGAGNSRLTNAMIERYLTTRGTARNWNTVRKLAELAGG
jgi:uncharacterized protein (DUF1697 family)